MRTLKLLPAVFAICIAGPASGVPYYWTDWTSWDPAGGTAIGVSRSSNALGMALRLRVGELPQALNYEVPSVAHLL